MQKVIFPLHSNSFRDLFRAVAALVLGLLLAMAPGSAASQGSTAPAAAGPPLTKVRLQLKWKHQFQFAGFYAALEKGFYRKAGLDVEILEAVEGQDSSAIVLDGKAEFGVGNADLVLLRGEGKPVVLLAPIFQHSPLIILTTTKSGIGSVHDLIGKRIATEPGAAELWAYLKQEGVATDRIQQVPLPFSPAPLVKGEVDALFSYSTDEPYFVRQAGAEPVIFNPRAGGIDFYGDSLFTTEAVLKRDPKLVRAFTDASLEGWKYALANPEELIDLILVRYSTRHSREHLRFEVGETEKLILPKLVELGYSNPGRWQRIAETYVELGLLKQVPSLDGFYFERNPQHDYRRFYVITASLLTALLLIGGVALRFFRMNRALAAEIASREAAEVARISAEKARTDAEENLRLSHEELVQVTDNVPVLISRVDDAGRCVFANTATSRWLNIPREKLLGAPFSGIFHGEDRTRFLENVGRAIAGKSVQMEADLAGPDGIRAMQLHLSPHRELTGAASVLLVATDVTARKEREQLLRELAATDELTGLRNRRECLSIAMYEFLLCRRSNRPMAVAAIDLDFFKDINETHGHAGGDEALRALADILRQEAGDTRILGRIGGDEFLIIMPGVGEEAALVVAKAILKRVAETPLSVKGKEVRLTLSVGISTLMPDTQSVKDLLAEADAALFDAKRHGRNFVAIAGRKQ